MPAITAPAPIVTSNAGKAQHNKVDVLAKRESVGAKSARRVIGLDIGSIGQCHCAACNGVYFITGFFNGFAKSLICHRCAGC